MVKLIVRIFFIILGLATLAGVVGYLSKQRTRTQSNDDGTTKQYWFVYDGDCGFCQQSVQRLKALNVQATFMANYDAATLLEAAGITLADTQRYALWIEQRVDNQASEWRVKRGAAAVNAALGQCIGIWPGQVLRLVSHLYAVPGIHQLQNGVYRLIADNRHRFGSMSCQRPTPKVLTS
jgi:predicted DCC family thiol-disulfide oxidoreductase YuxK